MIAALNAGVMVLATILTTVFYVMSVRPAALSERIGPEAYPRCAMYRKVCGVFMFVVMADYVVYLFYPLPLPLPESFGWPWWVSAMIAVAIALPAGYVWYRGMKDAGEETMSPKEDHTLYGGIYNVIRHPQALGETPYWFVMAFLLHSPFLVVFSIVWIPSVACWCHAEERDLILRYGEPYEDYRKRTSALIPGLW